MTKRIPKLSPIIELTPQYFHDQMHRAGRGNVGFFMPPPPTDGCPTFGPDKWLSITGPGVDGTTENIAIHYAALVESPQLNRSQPRLAFKLDELQDIDSFAMALLNPEDPLAQLIRSQIPDLKAWDGSSPLPPALGSQIVSELNNLVRYPELVSEVPFVHPQMGSLASVLADNADPTRENWSLLVKTLIEDAYPSQLTRHRRLRAAYGLTSTVWIGIGYGICQAGANLPATVMLVCRPNTCAAEIGAAIARGEATELRTGGDLIGAAFPQPRTIAPGTPGTLANDQRAFSLGFEPGCGIKAPRTRSEFNALGRMLTADDPLAGSELVQFNPFEMSRAMALGMYDQQAIAA
jgi:hypothetical protein